MTPLEAILWFLDNFFSWQNVMHPVGGAAFAGVAIWLTKSGTRPLRASMGIASGILANCIWELLVDKWHLFPFGAHTPDYLDIVNGGIGAAFVVLLYLFRSRK